MKKLLTVLLLCISVALFGFNYKNIMGIPEAFFKKETAVHATIYKPYKKNNITADGYKFKSKVSDTTKIIAVSRDLKKDYPFGSKVLVVGAGSLDGIYVVRDLMHQKWKHKIDILVDKKHALAKFNHVRLILLSDEFQAI